MMICTIQLFSSHEVACWVFVERYYCVGELMGWEFDSDMITVWVEEVPETGVIDAVAGILYTRRRGLFAIHMRV